jgi:hypothetical protein
MLPTNQWRDHFEPSIELYSTAAEAEDCIVGVERIEKHCSEVLEQTNSPLSEKLRAHIFSLDKIANRDKISDAVELCLYVLKQSECKFSNQSIPITLSTFAEVVRIKATMKSRTPKEISKMPFMTHAL